MKIFLITMSRIQCADALLAWMVTAESTPATRADSDLARLALRH